MWRIGPRPRAAVDIAGSNPPTGSKAGLVVYPTEEDLLLNVADSSNRSFPLLEYAKSDRGTSRCCNEGRHGDRKVASVFEQSRDALANIDRYLAEIGTDKSRVLFVTIYISSIGDKAEFNRAWDEWVDPANLPLRACVGVELEGPDLVELVVTAAVDDEVA